MCWNRGNIVLAAVLLALSACASTPDLSKWAESSAALSSAVAEDNRDTLARIDVILEKLKIGKEEEWTTLSMLGASPLKSWRKHRQSYYESAAIVNASMEAMMKYANAVSNLAAAGETGKKASESLVDSAKLIFTSLSATFPGGPVVGAAVATLDEIADLVTRVEAQDTLAETMGKMQDPIYKLAKLIGAYVNNQNNILHHVTDTQEAVIQGEFGPERISWTRKKIAEIDQIFKDDAPKDKLSKLSLLERETVHYRAFLRQISEARKWRDDKSQKLDEISTAAKIWAKAHNKAKEFLAKCGGMRSLNQICGTYTVASLLLAKDRIENVISAYKNEQK